MPAVALFRPFAAAALMRIQAQLSGHRRLHFGFAAVGLSELYVPYAVRRIRVGGGQVLLQKQVRRLLAENQFTGVELNDSTRIDAQYCICAVPPQDLQTIVPDKWREAAPFKLLSQFEPSPYLSCYIWFDRVVMRERFISHLWSSTRLNYDFLRSVENPTRMGTETQRYRKQHHLQPSCAWHG